MESGTTSLEDFLAFLRQSQLRFYQERDLGLDLYHSGWTGVALCALAVASAVVFLLALFHVIPVRRHVVCLLVGMGLLAAAIGCGRSYLSFVRLAALEATLIRETAGPLPASPSQVAAVVALPLCVGVANLTGNVIGCLYLALFWGRSLLSRSEASASFR